MGGWSGGWHVWGLRVRGMGKYTMHFGGTKYGVKIQFGT